MTPKLDSHGRPVRALGLCSGGLDSLLALEIIRRQGVAVTALTFISPFLSDISAKKGCAALGIEQRSVDFTDRHIELVKNPKHGLGSNMNPCIDCHTQMIRRAGEIMDREGYHFLFTGEVLGQRPMSQNRGSLNLVATESGRAEYLLRPLSAHRLKTTIPEAEGWVDRDKLYNFSGRSRKPQLALAEELGVTEFPAPAGGCLLTDPGFSNRLRRLLEERPLAGPREMTLLRHGRHFELGDGFRLLVGRNKADNDALARLIAPSDIGLKWADGPGPQGLIPLGDHRPPSAWQIDLAARIVVAYTKAQGADAPVEITADGQADQRRIPVTDKQQYQDRLI